MSFERMRMGVLVLDPDKASRLILVQHLGRFGFSADEASSFEEAKTLYCRGVYRAVSVQCPLPGATFTDVMNWLSGYLAVDNKPYILAVTSMPEVFSAELLLREGADDYLVKPASLDATYRALSRMQVALMVEPLPDSQSKTR